MVRKLIVPLDGSRLAEAVLPAAGYLAQHLQAEAVLLHVLEANPPREVHGEHHLASLQEAADYLSAIAQMLPPKVNWSVQIHNPPAQDVSTSIVIDALALQADLIIMCTHGRSGFEKRIFGSIAQSVLVEGKRPVLLIDPSEGEPAPEFICSRILVPLDGEPDHAQSLPVAKEIAQNCGSALHLLMVVYQRRDLPPELASTARLLPGTTDALLEIGEGDARAYLATRLADLEQTGIPLSSEVVRGDPTTEVIRAAGQVQADLIVLGTHAKKPGESFWSGSLTPRLIARTNLPLLLVPVNPQDES
jgi:nucleotide-binding universal stress UspA family protein